MLFVLVVFIAILNVFAQDKEGVSKTYPVWKGCSEELLDKIFLTDLSLEFLVEFTINKKGKAEDINVKAHHRAIAVDVIQLIKRMPKFKAPRILDGKFLPTKFNALVTIRLLK